MDHLPPSLKVAQENRDKQRKSLKALLYAPSTMISLVAASRDDKLLPSNHLTRSAAWFVDKSLEKVERASTLPSKLIPSNRRRHHIKEVPIEE